MSWLSFLTAPSNCFACHIAEDCNRHEAGPFFPKTGTKVLCNSMLVFKVPIFQWY